VANSTLCSRPISVDDCSCPILPCCAELGGVKNYDGGDCLPGFPGILPDPCACSAYSSGTPFEGSPDCPECEDYCLSYNVIPPPPLPCWLVSYTYIDTDVRLDGAVIGDWPAPCPDAIPPDPLIPPPHRMEYEGSVLVTVTYVGNGTTPEVVYLKVDSFSRAGSTDEGGSCGGSDALGFPWVMLADPNIGEAAGTRYMMLPLNNGVAELRGGMTGYAVFEEGKCQGCAGFLVTVVHCDGSIDPEG
jgi:hypothetical protein